jgi:hypothetical protein
MDDPEDRSLLIATINGRISDLTAMHHIAWDGLAELDDTTNANLGIAAMFIATATRIERLEKLLGFRKEKRF